MFTTLAHVHIADAERFLEVFAGHGLQARQAHGSLGASAFLDADNPGRAIVLIDWADRASFEGFVADPAVREVMRSGGAMEAPAFTFLTRTGVFPA
ncbi:MAG: Antibiotic biosynthesis monooxygenase [Holophagaceae bacterium]|nr:Antibiotic biosynthesis monooxygenase [Holophagaceae bacterium]